MNAPKRPAARQAALLIVDIQEKLLAAMSDRELVEANATRLALAAKELDIPIFATEQYPHGLGSTVRPLADLLPTRPAKMTFSACAIPELIEALHGRGLRQVTLAGIESHICVLQTAMDLMEMGFSVVIPADAVTSRFPTDRELAIRRLERAGAIVTSTEAILFEWVGTADSAHFQAIRRLVKDFDPNSPRVPMKDY